MLLVWCGSLDPYRTGQLAGRILPMVVTESNPMRRYDEPIEVVGGEIIGRGESPARFRWRNKVWQVSQLQNSWIEFSPWWLSLNGGVGPSEQEIWQVEAVCPWDGEKSIYELAHDQANGFWLLRAVVG